VTGGLPSARNATSIGHPDLWSKSRDSPPALAASASRINPPIAAPATSRRLEAAYGPIQLSSSCGDRNFNCFDGAHINGYDIACETGVSEAECADRCCAQANCKGFDFSASDHGMGAGRCCTGYVSRVERGFEHNGGTYRSCEKNSVTSQGTDSSTLVSYSGQCRANRYSYADTDCCWSDHDEPFRCDPGYRPELTGNDCHWWYGDGGNGEKMKCVQDGSYTTVARCEEHVTEFCRERNGFPIAFFFILMVWELAGCITYSVAACKAANVSPATHTSGTQMQTSHAAAVAVPIAGSVGYATALAQPVPAVPMAQGSVVPPPLPLEGVAVGGPMPQAQAVDKMGNPIYSGG